MWSFYVREILIPGRQPLFLALVAFLITLIATRMIRAGKGPFGNISAGDTHIHHVVPGLITLLIGGLLALGASSPVWNGIAGIMFGIGAALVLDEFAMVLHLDDVYWSNEGRLSADVAMLAAVVLFCGVVVAAPNDPPADTQRGFWISATAGVLFILVWLIPMVITVMKGKFWFAAAGIVFTPVLWVGAIRVAKPNSVWAHFRYKDDPAKVALAEQRVQRWDRIQNPPKEWVQTKIFGLSHDSDSQGVT